MLFSSCHTSSPLQKSPVGFYYPMWILSVPNHTRGIAKMFGSGWFNLLVFVANNVSGVRHSETSMWIHKHLLLVAKIPQKPDGIWRKRYLLGAIYCCQLQWELSGKWLYSKKWTLCFFEIMQVFMKVFHGRMILWFPSGHSAQVKTKSDLQDYLAIANS